MKILFLLSLLLVSLGLEAQEKIIKRDIMLRDYEYPYPTYFFDLEVQQQSLKMAFMLVEPEDYNGKNILLLHGKNFNSAYWGKSIETLTKEGFRIIAPDQIGFGKSSKPQHFQYSFQQLAENTKKLLDSLEIQEISVLGHSMGGMLATRFSLMYPAFTNNLILVNPIGLEDYKLKIPYQSVTDWYNNELEKSYESIKAYQKENYYDGDWNDSYARWARLLAGWTLNENYPVIAWNSALTYDMILTQPVVYEFEKLKVPTLLIIGTRDRTALGKNLVPEKVKQTMGLYERLGKETRDKISDAQLVELKDVGHLPHIEAFERYISPLLQYLRN